MASLNDIKANTKQQAEQLVASYLNNLSASPSSSSSPTLLQNSLEQLISSLSDGLVEREREVRLMCLAVLCGEHLLLIGPPGTAKSEMARRLSQICTSTTTTTTTTTTASETEAEAEAEAEAKSSEKLTSFYFERLFTKFTTPEEVFGPLSLSALEKNQVNRKRKSL